MSHLRKLNGWHSRGFLPHFGRHETLQFITFRLFDSIPLEALEQIRIWDEIQKRLGDEKEPCLARRERSRQKILERFLDDCRGSCLLRDRKAAITLEQSLYHGHEKQYHLHAWVIMPNHVHILLEALRNFTLSTIMQQIKSVSAHRINKTLERAGPVWQRDYFDRFIRDKDHYLRVVRYIHENPVSAGLCRAAEEWEFSSASKPRV